ncbi:MAG TPA: tetratricopeptide repeat protein, partial [Myxococcaceae bacterium]|nr:tetratricopeptide repeat protein [Myxococcaceae bacterium]
NLSLDSYRQLNEFDKIEEVSKKFLASALPGTFKGQVQTILQKSKSDVIGELALKSIEETGEVVEGLMKQCNEGKGTELGEKACYGAFVAVREKKDFDKQRELAQKIVSEYPKSQYISDVLLSTARQSAEAGDFDTAAQYFEQVGGKMGTESAGVDGYIAAAKLQLALDHTAEAIRDFESAAGVANAARKAEIYNQEADVWMKQNNLQRARAAAESALRVDKLDSKAGSIIAEVQAKTNPNENPKALVATLTAIAQGPNGQNEDTAKALWYLGEILFVHFKTMPADQVEQKVAALQELEGVYTQAASMGSPEWAVASLWRLGLAYQQLADSLETAPVPAGVTAEQWHAAVKEQVEPVKQRSEGAYKACVARAQSLEVFSTAVIGCRQKSENVKSPLVAATPGPMPAGIQDLQKRAQGATDPAVYEALGVAYLQARRLSLAQLTLGRAAELQDTRPSTHNALGYSFLLAGDAMSARAEYGRALDSDPTFEKARANLAALRCRFGDPEGAKRELSLIKDTSGLTGPDVDPDWRACK